MGKRNDPREPNRIETEEAAPEKKKNFPGLHGGVVKKDGEGVRLPDANFRMNNAQIVDCMTNYDFMASFLELLHLNSL